MEGSNEEMRKEGRKEGRKKERKGVKKKGTKHNPHLVTFEPTLVTFDLCGHFDFLPDKTTLVT